MTFFEEQQRFMSASGLLIRNVGGAVILIKPQYKETWQLPGGFVEPTESPRQAAEREVREELGVDVACGRLLCIDFKSATRERPACVQFVFDGGVLPAEIIAQFTPEVREVDRWATVPMVEAPDWAEEGGPASRMRNAIDALQKGTTVYLEDGQLTKALEDL